MAIYPWLYNTAAPPYRFNIPQRANFNEFIKISNSIFLFLLYSFIFLFMQSTHMSSECLSCLELLWALLTHVFSFFVSLLVDLSLTLPYFFFKWLWCYYFNLTMESEFALYHFQWLIVLVSFWLDCWSMNLKDGRMDWAHLSHVLSLLH